MARDLVFNLRLNEAELSALRQLAARECRNASEVMRELLRRSAKQEGCWPPPMADRAHNQAIETA